MKLLLLAGSAQARQIALAVTPGAVSLRVQMAEPPRGPAADWPVPYELRPFAARSDAAQMVAGCDGVVDASHSFDAATSGFGYAAADAAGIPFLCVQRPGWDIPTIAGAQGVPNIAAAMPLIGQGSRVFTTTGWGSLPEYAAFPGARLLLRQMHRHDRPPLFDFVETVLASPPFSVEDEAETLRRLAVDTLICRNIGGSASRPKIDAAQALKLGIIMVDPPALPCGADRVRSVPEAIAWIAAL